MAGDHQQASEPAGLEDQLRSMILTNNSSQANPAQQRVQPVVRLPPPGAHMNSQNAIPLHLEQTQWHAQNQSYGLPNAPSSVLPQNRGGAGGRRPPAGRGGYYKSEYPGTLDPLTRPQSFNDRGQPFNQSAQHQTHQQRARFQQQIHVDPNAFQRTGYVQQPFQSRPSGPQKLFNPHAPHQRPHLPTAPLGEQHLRQLQYLEQVAAAEISNVEMSASEQDDKDAFRLQLQQICHDVCETDPTRLPSVLLECFGSFKSGFATAGSDMDLVIVVKDQTPTSACFSMLEEDLPRVLERRLLQLGYGARLLTRTRVPIIKVCEKPDAEFLEKLREERRKWDDLPPEEKYPHLFPEKDSPDRDDAGQVVEADATNPESISTAAEMADAAVQAQLTATAAEPNPIDNELLSDMSTPQTLPQQGIEDGPEAQSRTQNGTKPPMKRPENKAWTRERKGGPLDFPKTGVGIQSDINFFNPLGLHNTQLLRCYSLCDPRVRPMILFVKAWAKRRKINSSYSGTLSSYGHVLMVLHYLINVAQPPVLPNLQSSWRPQGCRPADAAQTFTVEGWSVSFWRDEEEIAMAAQRGMLTNNRQSLGSLLARFFHYYSSQGGGLTFRWMQEVLSLRSFGGLLTKEEKGWVKAVTEESEGKRIQHRFLFCIEDPFELNHNVARTVTHNGIVAIRDEFRRANRILQAVGYGQRPRDGELFAQLLEEEDSRVATDQLKANAAISGAKGEPARERTSPASSMLPNQPIPLDAQNHHYQGAQRQNTHGANRPGGKHSTPAPKTKSFDLNDNEAFPDLGKAGKAPRRKKPAPTDKVSVEDYSEISGAKAKMIVEEVRRKKDEAQAESTAMGAAAAVLGDSD